MQMVICLNVTIRELNERVFRRFKAKAVEEGMKLGEALTQAMESWLREGKAEVRPKISDIKPFNWGKGTEGSSLEIDKVLYGEKD